MTAIQITSRIRQPTKVIFRQHGVNDFMSGGSVLLVNFVYFPAFLCPQNAVFEPKYALSWQSAKNIWQETVPLHAEETKGKTRY